MKSNEKGAVFLETDLNTLFKIINYLFNFLVAEHFFPFLHTNHRYSSTFEELNSSFRVVQNLKIILIW